MRDMTQCMLLSVSLRSWKSFGSRLLILNCESRRMQDPVPSIWAARSWTFQSYLTDQAAISYLRNSDITPKISCQDGKNAKSTEFSIQSIANASSDPPCSMNLSVWDVDVETATTRCTLTYPWRNKRRGSCKQWSNVVKRLQSNSFESIRIPPQGRSPSVVFEKQAIEPSMENGYRERNSTQTLTSVPSSAVLNI